MIFEGSELINGKNCDDDDGEGAGDDVGDDNTNDANNDGSSPCEEEHSRGELLPCVQLNARLHLRLIDDDDVDDDVEGHDSENDDDDEKVTWRLGDLQIICNSGARESQAEGELGARHLVGQHVNR